MGVCCTSTNKNERRSSNVKSAQDMKVDVIPDEASILDDGGHRKIGEKPIQQYLRAGDATQVKNYIERKEIVINEYTFGGADKTLLHEAVQLSDNTEVISVILNAGADVNAIERETGNTALILAALDLKADMVRTILKYQPKIVIKNRKGHDIFVFLREYFTEKKGNKKTDLTPEQEEKLQLIMEMLNDYKLRSDNIENLDHEGSRHIQNHDDSGPVRNRV